MSKRKSSNEDRAVKTLVLVTALLNLVKALVDLITNLINRLGK